MQFSRTEKANENDVMYFALGSAALLSRSLIRKLFDVPIILAVPSGQHGSFAGLWVTERIP
jgi:hypothetical protein